MAITKKADLEVTHGLLVHHTNAIREQLLKPNTDWDEVIGALRRIEGECTNSIELAKKVKGVN
jgi:hypothetical protein